MSEMSAQLDVDIHSCNYNTGVSGLSGKVARYIYMHSFDICITRFQLSLLSKGMLHLSHPSY